MKYFSYCPMYGGFELHETAEEAEAAVEDALDIARCNAFDGWSEEVVDFCWGEINQKTAETLRRLRTEEDQVEGDSDTIVDYGLVDVT